MASRLRQAGLWMKHRRWALAAVGLMVALAVLDTGAWLLATRALRTALLDWQQRQRASGVDVALGEPVPGGWPLAATQRFEARLGPAGVPAGLVLEATVTTGVWLAHPRVGRSTLGAVRVTAPSGAATVATADPWTVDVLLAEPERAHMAATDLRIAWPSHLATLASVTGDAASGPKGIAFTLQAVEIGMGHSGLKLPVAFGEVVRSLDSAGVLQGGLPPAGQSAEASLQAWREAGGELDMLRLAISYGPLDATLKGRFGLDAALRPAGSGVVAASGLVPLLEAFGSAGTIPQRTGQAAGGILALLGGGSSGGVDIPFDLAEGRLKVAGFPVARVALPGGTP